MQITDEMVDAAAVAIHFTDDDDAFALARTALTAALAQSETQPVAWIYEDELPNGYPYDAMFPYSKVDGVRMFPVYAPGASPVPAKREAGVDGKAVIRKIVTGVLTDHCGQQGGLPRVDWYALRGELIEALSTSSTPADGEGLTAADDSQEQLSSMSDHSCKTSTPAPVHDLRVEDRSRMQLASGYYNSFETVIGALEKGGAEAQAAGHIAHGACLLHAAVELRHAWADRMLKNTPVKPLFGTRFKLSFNQAGNCTTFRRDHAEQLEGEWVWLIEATNGKNDPLYAAAPPVSTALPTSPSKEGSTDE